MQVYSRTIFLLVRGVNMLGGAFKEATKEVETLEEKERQLANTAYKTMFGGAALLAFGLLLAKGLAGFLETTSKGVLILDSLGLAWDRFASRLGTGIAKAIEPQAKIVIDILDALGANQGTMDWLGSAAVYLTEFMVAVGGFLALRGAWNVVSGVLGSIFQGVGVPILMKLAPELIMESGGGTFSQILSTFLINAFAPLGATTVVEALGLGLGITIPIILTLAVVKTLWDWYNMNEQEQIDWAIGKGNEAGSPFEKPYGGTEPGYGYLPQDIIVNVYGDFNGTPTENGESIANAVADVSNTGQYTYK